MKKLPKSLFIRWNDDSDEPWLQAVEDAGEFAEVNEKFAIGRYELVEKGTVEAVPKYLRSKTRR